MYLEYFGLKESPFSIAPNPRFLYMSQQYQEALAHLVYGVTRSGGFIVLTGEVGTGKTTVCRCFLERLPDGCDVAFIFNPKLSVRELLSTICDELKIKADGFSQKGLIDALNQYLLGAHAKGRKTVLIIDEAQNLSPSVLEQLRLLTNLETNDAKLLQIVLLGQPELKELFARRELRQLAQRVTARYHLEHLSFQETKAYLNHRLTIAGTHEKLFSDMAIRAIHRISGGIPRLINLLSDRSLLGAYGSGKRVVDLQIVLSSRREVLGKRKVEPRQKFRMIAAVALVVSMGYIASVFHNPEEPGLNLNTFAGKIIKSTSSDTMADGELTTASAAPLGSSESITTKGLTIAKPGVIRPEQFSTIQESSQPIGSGHRGMDGFSSHTAVVIEKPSVPTSVEKPSRTAATKMNPSGTVQRNGVDPVVMSVLESGLGSDQAAFRSILKMWGIDSGKKPFVEPKQWSAEALCGIAESMKLGCFTKEGSLEDLEIVNRPAVVKLKYLHKQSQQEREALVTLLNMDNGSAEIELGDKTVRFTKGVLEKLWGGKFTVLWKLPPVYHGDIVVGTIGPEIRWLSQQLGHIQQDPELIQGLMHYDEGFREKVKQFQAMVGLEPDGIVGPYTLMKINAGMDKTVPVLAKSTAEKGG